MIQALTPIDPKPGQHAVPLAQHPDNKVTSSPTEPESPDADALMHWEDDGGYCPPED